MPAGRAGSGRLKKRPSLRNPLPRSLHNIAEEPSSGGRSADTEAAAAAAIAAVGGPLSSEEVTEDLELEGLEELPKVVCRGSGSCKHGCRWHCRLCLRELAAPGATMALQLDISRGVPRLLSQ